MSPVVTELAQKYGPMVLILLALGVTDVVSGVASALKRGAFHWSAVGNTYRTTIVPNVLGWVAVTFLVEVVAHVPGSEAYAGPTVALGISIGFYTLTTVTLGNSIYTNLREIAGLTPPPPAVTKTPTPWPQI